MFRSDYKGRSRGEVIFTDINLSVPKGKSLGVVGDRGSGAIEIVFAFGAVLGVHAGSVVVGNQDFEGLRSARKRLQDSRRRSAWAARELGFITLHPPRGETLLDSWLSPLHLTNVPVDKAWGQLLFSALGLGQGDLNTPVSGLVPHKQDAAAVAIAFNASPSLAIWPGTDAGFSSSTSRSVIGLAKRAAALRDTTFIYATQDPEIGNLADLSATVADGRLLSMQAAGPRALPFISYVSEDDPAVTRLETDLAAHGVELWRDRHQLKPGLRWRDEIRKAIINGQHFVACFSSASEAKGRSYARAELDLALDELRLRPRERAWFIPVRMDECQVPDIPIGGGEYLSDLHYVDLAGNWADGVSRLAQALKSS